MIYVTHGAEFEKKIKYMISSHNFTQLQKTNRPNWSFGSEDVPDLKSTILGGGS
jgi:hypothetical protein